MEICTDTATEIQITRAESEDILSACINQKTDFVYNAKTGELKSVKKHLQQVSESVIFLCFLMM